MKKTIAIGVIGGWLFLLTVGVVSLNFGYRSHAQLASLGTQNGALFNTTSVNVAAASSADQNLQQLVEPAGNLNYVGKTAHVRVYGTATSGASANGTWTLKLKICTVSGCGSGTAITLATLGPTGTQVINASNAPWVCDYYVSTLVTGATGNFFAEGKCHVETTATAAQTDSPTFVAQTIAASSNIDLTGQLFWQATIANSGTSANNSMFGRLMIRELVN